VYFVTGVIFVGTVPFNRTHINYGKEEKASYVSAYDPT
jgi:hypothetical protein